MYTAEKPQRSIRRAVAALNAPGIATQPLAMARRSSAALLTLFICRRLSAKYRKTTTLLYYPTLLPDMRWLALIFGFAALDVLGLEWSAQPGYRSAPVIPSATGKAGFRTLDAQATGVTFTNHIPPERHYTNQIYLNGSGVAAGDVDSDGWCDVFFCGLSGRSTLYRNGGAWKFEDVTARCGVAKDLAKLDATGAALADLDGDADLDLVINS